MSQDRRIPHLDRSPSYDESKQMENSHSSSNKTVASNTSSESNIIENLAFVVNIPVAFKNRNDPPYDFRSILATIKKIQDAYLKEYNSSNCPPFKMVFCVNSHANQEKALNEFKQRWDSIIQKRDDLNRISLMTYAWNGDKFPYGEVRNALMHSKETQNEITAFKEAGYYPYVAIGDADTGSRLVEVKGQTQHIFAAIEQRLNRSLGSPPSELSSSDESKHDEEIESSKYSMSISARPGEISDGEKTSTQDLIIRPYLIAGGYCPTSTEDQQSIRTTSLQRDMEIRGQLAKKVNPLGPYFPEPNLFIDGQIADKVNFGNKNSEFSHLRKEIAKFVLRDMMGNRPTEFAEEEWAEKIKADIKNNRHGTRGKVIATFFDLAIETDTDRLFKKVGKMTEEIEINNNDVAQHHQHGTHAKAGLILSRFDKRNGGDVYKKINEFVKENKDDMSKVMELYHELVYRQKQEAPGYKPDLLDQSYEQHGRKNQEVMTLVDKLIKASKSINTLKDGQPNRTAADFSSVEYTALDIVNTAIATVYGKDINTLLRNHWENELKYFNQAYQQQNNSASTSDQQNRQLSTSSALIDPDEGIDVQSHVKNVELPGQQTTWKIFSNLINRKVNDQETNSTSEFIYKCSPGNPGIKP